MVGLPLFPSSPFLPGSPGGPGGPLKNGNKAANGDLANFTKAFVWLYLKKIACSKVKL